MRRWPFVLMLMFVVWQSWLGLSWADEQIIPTAAPTTTTAATVTTVRSLTDGELRSFYAELLADRREARGDDAPPTTTTTTATVPTTTVPASQCDLVPTPSIDPYRSVWPSVMRWCSTVLVELEGWGHDPGELSHLLLSMACESAGDPNATNPSSGTAGLFQHRPEYWDARSLLWLGQIGDPYDPADNIAVGVALVQDPNEGQRFDQAWDGCHARQSFQQAWAGMLEKLGL